MLGTAFQEPCHTELEHRGVHPAIRLTTVAFPILALLLRYLAQRTVSARSACKMQWITSLGHISPYIDYLVPHEPSARSIYASKAAESIQCTTKLISYKNEETPQYLPRKFQIKSTDEHRQQDCATKGCLTFILCQLGLFQHSNRTAISRPFS